MGTGANLAAAEERGITIYSPCEVPDPAQNPALRDDATQPVAEADWDRLPARTVRVAGKKSTQLDKAAFVYNAERNEYRCPLGKPLPYLGTTTETEGGTTRVRNRYRADESDCASCPLRARCLQGAAKARQVNREQHAAHQERHAQRMAKPESQAIYAERRHAGERPFAVIKQKYGLRQFLLRGLERVTTEWRWGTLAFNLERLMSLLRSRAGPAESHLNFQPS